MISILCPSRGRPELAKRMIDSALARAGAVIEILLYINDDDPKLNQYIEIIDHQHLIVGPDRSPAYSWNRLAELAKHDILFLMGDDAWFETENWAIEIVKVFDQYPDKIVFAFPSVEGLEWRGGRLTADHCPHFCLHKNWINTLGYFIPPHFWHWYIDTWFRDIAKMIGRFHGIKHVSVPLLVDYEDETDSRKDRLSNRERDHWLWAHTQRWLHADAYALQQEINKHALNYKKG
jgi:glycosyltransferase involved in cell wall biosynthesis